MIPNAENLRCFDAVATTLHFRQAADRVALSPAAFSDRIRRLEEELGVELLERNTRRVALTEAGEKLRPHARSILDALERCAGVARGPGAAPRAEIRLGTRYELGLSWVVPALDDLEAAVPELRIHLGFDDGPGLARGLASGRLDAALTSARAVPAGFEYRTIHEEAYVLVGSAALLAGNPFKGPGDAHRHLLLDLDEDLPLARYLLDRQGGSAAWRFEALRYLGTLAAVRLRLLGGRGIAVLPRYFVAGDLKAGTLRRLLPRTPLQSDAFRLLWRKGHPRGEAFQRLAEALKERPLR
jgi:DNA-binding transcriptional LysR family regulator